MLYDLEYIKLCIFMFLVFLFICFILIRYYIHIKFMKIDHL